MTLLLLFVLLVVCLAAMWHNANGPPDFVIGDPRNPYLLRWWLIPRNPWFNIYLHKILRSDDDRALHDHPWWNVSVLLRGSYDEVVPSYPYQHPMWDYGLYGTRTYRRRQGQLVFRRPHYAHRLVVRPGEPCWTLFITGPRVREWGFRCAHGWLHWQKFTHPADKGQIGQGCA
jgi:hypothetical protein